MKSFWLLLLITLSTVSNGQNFDLKLLNELHTNRNPGIDGLMNSISYSTYVFAPIVPVAQLLHGFAEDDKISLLEGVQSASALAITLAAGYGLSRAVDRRPPYHAHAGYQPYHQTDDPTFPSVKTALAFSTATTLSLQYKRWYVVAPAYLWAGAVGYSRVHLGESYPSDVLGGALVGAAAAYVSYKINIWLYHKWQKQPKTAHHDPN